MKVGGQEKQVRDLRGEDVGYQCLSMKPWAINADVKKGEPSVGPPQPTSLRIRRVLRNFVKEPNSPAMSGFIFNLQPLAIGGELLGLS